MSILLCFLAYSATNAFNLVEFLKNPDSNRKTTVGVVTKVIDGDTIVIDDQQKIRYIGINAPETHKKEGENWIKVVEPHGEEAFIFNKELVEGKTVRIELENRTTDIYGRTLAYVFLNNELVNAKLLSQGLAFPYDISKSKYYAILRKSFFEALRNKRGLYKNVFYPLTLNKHLGEYGWYREKINSVYYSDKTVIKTDYVDIHLLKRPHSKDRGIKAGKIGYFYGKLLKKRERYILLSENPHHIFLE